MEITRRDIGHVTVIRPLEKRIDAARAPEFKAAVVGVIDEGQASIVIDLAEVEFLDSSGLGALVACLKRVGQRGDLAIAGAGKSVAKVLTLTRMDKVFRIFNTADDAVAAMNA